MQQMTNLTPDAPTTAKHYEFKARCIKNAKINANSTPDAPEMLKHNDV
jgi:hypothetical protein